LNPKPQQVIQSIKRHGL